MSKAITYQILKELGGVNVTVQQVIARLKEKYPDSPYLASRAGLKLYRLHKSGVVERKMCYNGRHSGYSYTIIDSSYD